MVTEFDSKAFTVCPEKPYGQSRGGSEWQLFGGARRRVHDPLAPAGFVADTGRVSEPLIEYWDHNPYYPTVHGCRGVVVEVCHVLSYSVSFFKVAAARRW